MSFQILCLSGGGYLGLYTAKVLAGLEEELGGHTADHFDLISGTSVGGIIALGLAARIPATTILEAITLGGPKIFSPNPPPSGWLRKTISLIGGAKKAKYDPAPLRKIITDLLGPETYIGDLKHRTIIPTVNLTKGSPQVFKTPHHGTFVRDWKVPVVDVALATSAAPTFFPLHRIGGEMFADGGLYANSPDLLALHEAEHFLDQSLQDVRILSIGTTTASLSVSNSLPLNLGWKGWMEGQLLTSVMIAAQQINSGYILKHRLGDRYYRIDRDQSAGQQASLALDVASPAATRDLLGMAEASLRDHLARQSLRDFWLHEVEQQNFFKGTGR